MSDKSYDIFISYRRDAGVHFARNIKKSLENDGYRVFMDLDNLRAGKFNEQLYTVIDSVQDFILVLTKGSLDRCCNEGDWVANEIQRAMEAGKNIIPFADSGFSFPEKLPDALRELPAYQGVKYDPEQDAGSMDRMKKMLKSKPVKFGKPHVSFRRIVVMLLLLVSLGGGYVWQQYVMTDKNNVEAKAERRIVAKAEVDVEAERHVNEKSKADAEAERLASEKAAAEKKAKTEAEAKRLAAEKEKAAAEAKRRAEEKDKAAAEAKRRAEEMARTEAEAKRLAAEKAKAEAAAADLAKKHQEIYRLQYTVQQKKAAIDAAKPDPGQTFDRHLKELQDNYGMGQLAVTGNVAQAYDYFTRALKAAEWLENNIPLRNRAAELRRRIAPRKSAADRYDGTKLAYVSYQQGEARNKAGEADFDNGKFESAALAFRAAVEAYGKAAQEARSIKQQNLLAAAQTAEKCGDWNGLLKIAGQLREYDSAQAAEYRKKAENHLDPVFNLLAQINGKNVAASVRTLKTSILNSPFL